MKTVGEQIPMKVRDGRNVLKFSCEQRDLKKSNRKLDMRSLISQIKKFS
jgi:hypothetical protein